MAIDSVASSPLASNLKSELNRAFVYAKKVPVRYYHTAIVAVALFWVCHTLANLFWVLMPLPAAPTPKVMPVVHKVSSITRENVDISDTLALEIFGKYNAEAAKPEVGAVDTSAPIVETKLNIELFGVIEASEPELSWAMIGQGNTQKLYKIDDAIENTSGAKITKIFKRKVVINNRGKLEELRLYGDDGKTFATSYTPPQRVASRPEPKAPVRIKEGELKKIKNIGDVVRFMVATENGKMIGYKVRPGRQRELFNQVGLKTDDIVVSVNGIEVNEPQKVREVYQALKTATEANLEVLRDGTTESIQIVMDSD